MVSLLTWSIAAAAAAIAVVPHVFTGIHHTRTCMGMWMYTNTSGSSVSLNEQSASLLYANGDDENDDATSV